jgi:hypothetical protein
MQARKHEDKSVRLLQEHVEAENKTKTINKKKKKKKKKSDQIN